MSPQIFSGASNSRRTGKYRAHFLVLVDSMNFGQSIKDQKFTKNSQKLHLKHQSIVISRRKIEPIPD